MIVVDVKWKRGKDPTKWKELTRSMDEAEARLFLERSLRKDKKYISAWRIRELRKPGISARLIETSEKSSEN